MIPSLMLANFVNFIPQLITSLLLIEIAVSFDTEVGVAGQLGTTQSIVSAVMALLMTKTSIVFICVSRCVELACVLPSPDHRSAP